MNVTRLKCNRRFTTELMLVIPNLDKKIRMKVNASDYITERVLLMKCEDGRWKLVVYLSKLLNKTE